MDYTKILIFLLCVYMKAPLEYQQTDRPSEVEGNNVSYEVPGFERSQITEARQILEELSAVLPELPTSPGPLLQELSRRRIIPQHDHWIEDMQNIFSINEAYLNLDGYLLISICHKLGIVEDLLKKEDVDKVLRSIRSDRGLDEIFNQITNYLDAILMKEYNRINRTPKVRKDLIAYGLQTRRRLEANLAILKRQFRPILNGVAQRDIELQTLLRDLKWAVESQALFIYDDDVENPIDGQLEVAQEHLQNRSMKIEIAFRALVTMSQSTVGLRSSLEPLCHYYNHVKRITLKQHAEVRRIYQKFEELNECLGELCGWLQRYYHYFGLLSIPGFTLSYTHSCIFL